ncbi:hypothetical protein [Egicoccus sp. AB-alg2]|uniref:hypothetical protein n=1 Tax=Egicoccus sp. AB-alg2 TaxID=3242693 RepID=UPI00359EB561
MDTHPTDRTLGADAGDIESAETEPESDTSMSCAYDLAEQQHGVIGRFQLVDILGAGRADHLLRIGRLEPVVRGIWRVRGGAVLPEQPAFAAALRARPQGCVTGPVALGLYAVPGFVGA